MRLRIALLGVIVPSLLLEATQEQLPRFRAGTNLVRVDAYVSLDDVAVTDLKAEDFQVFEDDRLQTVENFQLIAARAPIPQSERVDPTNVRDMRDQANEAARVFTLFFDPFFTSLSGSYHARQPIIDALDRVIGPDDLVGAMTPEMSPSAITFSRKTTSIESAVTKTWFWGQRDRLARYTPEEDGLFACYPDVGETAGIAARMIARQREQRTLDALDGLVTHLDGLRPERKFVMVFTEGWPLYRPDESLARVLEGRVPTGDPLGTDPRTGGLRRAGGLDAQTGHATLESCDRQRTMLAYIDHETEFRELLQRANRANVSFYPIDARGLIVFDTPISWGVPPGLDAAWLRKRHDDLRTMASQTDGDAILDTSNVAEAMRKAFRDVGSYYLLSYYSTNQKLDGRFRRIRVEVKRDGVEVRSRPGYLALTEAEVRAAGGTTTAARAGGASPPPPTVTRALDAIVPARGNLPVRIQAAGARGTVRAIIELDPATARQPEWLAGGTMTITVTPDRGSGAGQSVTVPVDSGQRSITFDGLDTPLAPGRYSVRAELTPRNGRVPIQVTTFVTVPATDAVAGTSMLALRRGPSTGLAYVPTADPRFRRTERLRVEVPLIAAGVTGAGRMLTREGKSMPLVVTYSTRTDAAREQTLGVADVALAPLAAGEYVLEVSLTGEGKTEVATYGFRIVP